MNAERRMLERIARTEAMFRRAFADMMDMNIIW